MPNNKQETYSEEFIKNKGRFSDPVLREQALMARRAKQEAEFRDPQKYLKNMFNAPKKGGSTLKLTCRAIEAATRKISEYILEQDFTKTSELNMKDFLNTLDNLKKTISFLDQLNSESAGKAINQWLKIDNMTVNNGSKTGGVVGSILDVEPTKLSELTTNGPGQA